MAVNLWPNADFESGITDWETVQVGSAIAQSTTKKWEQSNSIRTNSTHAYGGSRSLVKYIVSGSTEYTFSIYINPDNATVSYRLRAFDQDYNQFGATVTSTYTADTWTRITKTFTTGSDDTGVQIQVDKNNDTNNDYWYLDGAMLEIGGSASTWVNYISAGQFYLFEEFADDLGLELHNFSNGGDEFKVGLINDTLAPTQAASAAWGTFSANEVSGTGYTAGGQALASQSWSEASGVATFDADDVEWSMNAAGPTDARYAIVYNNTNAGKEAIGYMDLGSDRSLRQGDIVLKWAATGIFRFTYQDLS